MRFDDLIAALQSMKEEPLPGAEAHDAILPKLARQRKEAFEKDPNPKSSGVAATFFPKEERAHILLIERQSYDGVHSGQVGFPGGKAEKSDTDLIHTALREMEEEVGIAQSVPTFVRALSEVYIPPSRFLVRPYVFYLDHHPMIIPDPREVAEVIHLPVDHLLNDANIVEGSIQVSTGIHMKTPYFGYERYQIWGATAMMLYELRTLLKKVL